MIGWLQGTVVVKQANTVILNVGGVGYEITVPVSVIENLGQGQMAELFIHQAIREDGHFLYGFATLAQRALFREVIRVSGIGPKLGLLILSGFSPDGLVATIREQNTAALIKLPGVGKKTAERLLIELKDRIGGNAAAFGASSVSAIEHTPQLFAASVAQETLEALLALGFSANDSAKYVDAAVKACGDNAETGKLLKYALSISMPGAK